MRFLLPLFAALALTLPLAAHADTIDDFTLVGQGHTITFSVPATTTIQDHPHIVSLGDTVSATIDGVSGYSETGTFFLLFLNPPSMTLTVPFASDGGILALYGSYLLDFTIIPTSNPSPSHPDDIVTTFAPGTYSLTEEEVTPTFLTAPYTLTIAAEPALTPEPASLTLLATGVVAVLSMKKLSRFARP